MIMLLVTALYQIFTYGRYDQKFSQGRAHVREMRSLWEKA